MHQICISDENMVQPLIYIKFSSKDSVRYSLYLIYIRYTKKSLAAGALPRTPLGDLMTLIRVPSRTPTTRSRLRSTHPTSR